MRTRQGRRPRTPTAHSLSPPLAITRAHRPLVEVDLATLGAIRGQELCMADLATQQELRMATEPPPRPPPGRGLCSHCRRCKRQSLAAAGALSCTLMPSPPEVVAHAAACPRTLMLSSQSSMASMRSSTRPRPSLL